MDGLIASPKLDGLSSSGRPHVRIGIVTYEGEVERMERVDLTIEEFQALADRSAAVPPVLRTALNRVLGRLV